MSKGTAVDRAFDRFQILSRLIEMEQQRARANPQDHRYFDLGITEAGDTKVEAIQKTSEALDDLARLIEHVAILDMVSSFEHSCRDKLTSKIGAIRNLVKKDSKKLRQDPYALKLIRKCEEFRGLQDILELIEDALSKEVVASVKQVRDSRNAFAHGTNLKISPAVEPSHARDNLNEIALRL